MLKRLCSFVAAAATLVLLAPNPSQSAPDDRRRPIPPFAAWRNVESFTAQATMHQYSWNHVNTTGRFVESSHIESLSFKLDLKRINHAGPEPDSPNASWAVENCQIRGSVEHNSYGWEARDKSNHRWSGAINGPAAKGGSFSMDLRTGKWNFYTVSALEKPFKETGHSHVEWGHGKIDDVPIDREVTHITQITAHGKLVDGQKPGVIAGTTVIKDGNARYGSTRTYRVVMWPTFTDVECIVEIDKYEKWLPAANLVLPKEPGSKLWLKATLQPKEGKPALLVQARRFRFELVDSSCEPGVAMNFPLLGPAAETQPVDDPEPDLRFYLGLFSGTLSQRDQKAMVDPLPTLDGKDSARIAVDAFDFGAYANLTVVCELEDGREIAGILKTGTTADITLPKRSDGSKIADSWRRKFKLGADDAQDGDDEPMGDKNLGDGFSNYEEYRGFVVGGAHNRTLPNAKDLFIRNEIGAAAAPGIWLFRDATDLKVHHKLKATEIPESRIMNANRSARSPRSSQVSQHGLLLTYGTAKDHSSADFIDIFKAWRPVNVKAVRILRTLGPDDGELTELLTDEDADQLDATIAHELAHAVGVRHHGRGDIGWVIWVESSSTAPNGTEVKFFEERSAVWNEGASKWEASPVIGRFIDIYSSPGTRVGPRSVGARFFLNNKVWVGGYGGQHSGSDQCVMRYDCAGAYVLPGRPRDRIVSPGEPVGKKMCWSSTGVGINDPGANPARYGNATAGDCKHKFAVRDDAPDSQVK
jgi:hypothetical protein